MALSRDERIAVVVYRSAGIVTVFALDSAKAPTSAMIAAKTEIDTGADSEPFQAVIGADDDTAYVLFRSSHTVAKLSSLHRAPVLETARVTVGSEPTAIAISPNGQRLFVANWGEGTISVINTRTFAEPDAADPVVDLNQALVETGTLGELATRPALAHPRALAVSDDGDDVDDDETLYATEFFAQSKPSVMPRDDHSDVDIDRQGFVYQINLKSARVSTIAIAPVNATGFLDSNGNMTGCFPNQLYAAAIDNGRLFVTSMCTSPRGPLGPSSSGSQDQNFKTLFHPSVFVIDTATNSELPLLGRRLTQELARYYDAGEDASDERMPLIPNDIAFADTAQGASAYVSALGADAVFRLDYDQSGVLQSIGSPGARAITNGDATNGLPVGVAVSKRSPHPFALVANDGTQKLWVVDRSSESVVSIPTDTPRAQDLLESDANVGRQLFATGRDVWSSQGQAWSSCESCHPGGLSDGVTWFFARGPRRTISTAGTYDKAPNLADRKRRMLLWGANIDEVHDIETIVRNVSGGAGAVLWTYAEHPNRECRLVYDGVPPTSNGTEPCGAQKATSDLENGLNGSLSALVAPGMFCAEKDACNRIGSRDWDRIDAFIRSLRAPRGPTNLRASTVTAGARLFEAGRCAGCHGGPGWTVSRLFYQPSPEQNGSLPFIAPAGGALDLGLLRETRYFVDPSLLRLNPPSRIDQPAMLRTAPTAEDEATQIASLYKASSQTDEQIQCALRDVGTFPSQVSGSSAVGIVAADAPPVFEVRQDMQTLAQGANGFSVPSLFGLAEGAPYFHAGNARTLEEALDDDAFATHLKALADPGFLEDPLSRSDQIIQLVAFLLSIDESTPTLAVPSTDASGSAIRYDFCPQ